MSVFPPQTLNELEFPILRTMWTKFVCQKKKKRKPQAQVSTQYNKFKKTKYNQSTK